jgi:hypothetical protein
LLVCVTLFYWFKDRESLAAYFELIKLTSNGLKWTFCEPRAAKIFFFQNLYSGNCN